MKLYFASVGPITASVFQFLYAARVRHFLCSYVESKDPRPFPEDCQVILDSGAFSVWNKGEVIDIEEYLTFCLRCPPSWVVVNLDVIPKTGATRRDIHRAADQSFAHYQYLCHRLPGRTVMPVYHYGEALRYLKQYMAVTDYIGVSPANDTAEKVKRQFLTQCFALTRDDVRCHGFGYTSHSGMLLFPFYSVDSTSFKRLSVHNYKVKTNCWVMTQKLRHLLTYNVRRYQKQAAFITEVWRKRGVHWNDD